MSMNKDSPTSSRWPVVDVPPGQPLGEELLRDVFFGDVAAVRVRKFLTSDQLDVFQRSADDLLNGKSKRYQGLELGSALGVSSHWEFGYTRFSKEWDDPNDAYYSAARQADELRRQVFADVGDPVEMVADLLAESWPGPVGTARHPTTRKHVYAGLLRTGAPRLHLDWARYDWPGLDAVMQTGWSVYLRTPESGGHLKMYRKLGVEAGKHLRMAGSGPVGNYALPRSVVRNVESVVVRCEAGDWVMAPNRFVHEVTPCSNPDRRLTVAAHVAWMRDGSLAQFS